MMAIEHEESSKIALIEHTLNEVEGWSTGRETGCWMGAIGSQTSWLSGATGGGGTTIVNLLSLRTFLLVVRGGRIGLGG